jgi:uncharacterized protein (TIGR00156 family)
MSKVIPALSCAALCTVAVAAHADPQGGGFEGPDHYQTVTVAETAGLPDDAAVRLEGFVVKALGDEEYEFRDDTGTLVVEIDDDDCGGLEATPELRVQIHGEIDHERQQVELDVDGIRAVE